MAKHSSRAKKRPSGRAKKQPAVKALRSKKATGSKKVTRSRKATRPPKPPKSHSVPTGPVTLEQARALAAAAAPAERAAKAALADTTVASVGAEQRKLELKQEQERRKRIKEYTATLTIMKTRGVKGLAAASAESGGPAAAAASRPLQVFAEGDSWFDYPVPFFGGGIIPRLESKLGVPILNLASAGDEVRFMLGVKERQLIVEQFVNGCPAGGPWDAMLFSGGGNDIVDNPLVLWLKDFDATLPPAALIHQARYDAALGLVRAGYEDLIKLRDTLSPQTHLFFHAYDFALPDGRGICHKGPWLKPAFDLRGFPSVTAGAGVVKVMLEQLAAMLGSLQAAHAKVTFINGHGTLAADVSSWHNELHPAKNGFTSFADLFQRALKSAFPGQVP